MLKYKAIISVYFENQRNLNHNFCENSYLASHLFNQILINGMLCSRMYTRQIEQNPYGFYF